MHRPAWRRWLAIAAGLISSSSYLVLLDCQRSGDAAHVDLLIFADRLSMIDGLALAPFRYTIPMLKFDPLIKVGGSFN